MASSDFHGYAPVFRIGSDRDRAADIRIQQGQSEPQKHEKIYCFEVPDALFGGPVRFSCIFYLQSFDVFDTNFFGSSQTSI
jgi:hypothetical protein